MDPEFDFKKLSFVQEASHAQHEQNLVSAQSNVQSAWRKSLQAAWNLFVTNLRNDWVLQEKYQASAEMSSQRQRSVLVSSLEAGAPINANHAENNIQVRCLHPHETNCYTTIIIDGLYDRAPTCFNSSCCLLQVMEQTLQKMHSTAWKLINEFTTIHVPVFDVSGSKTPQGRATCETKATSHVSA